MNALFAILADPKFSDDLQAFDDPDQVLLPRCFSSGKIRVILYAKGRPLWRDGAGGRTGFLELFGR
jgi:hypothetical protein